MLLLAGNNKRFEFNLKTEASNSEEDLVENGLVIKDLNKSTNTVDVKKVKVFCVLMLPFTILVFFIYSWGFFFFRIVRISGMEMRHERYALVMFIYVESSRD